MTVTTTFLAFACNFQMSNNASLTFAAWLLPPPQPFISRRLSFQHVLRRPGVPSLPSFKAYTTQEFCLR
jgi:hypothetical protein